MCLVIVLMAITIITLAAFWRQILLAFLVLGVIILITYLIRRGKLTR